MIIYEYNDLKIEHDELESCAENWAENYWYDKSNYNRPECMMTAFYNDFGQCDDHDRYADLFEQYISLCVKYRDDPNVYEKYNDSDDDDDKTSVCTMCGASTELDYAFCSDKCSDAWYDDFFKKMGG